jgi:4-amino-4-deoxy-L-arabinose transferase-like glycosyltransferase
VAAPLTAEGAPPSQAAGDRRVAGLCLVALLAVTAYFYGLDSPHAPKNGDEYAFEHITRLTAASGSLLPLRSDIPILRNTKPPLLFWQGIASTDGGREWTLARLRYPSVVYTLLTTALVLAVGFRVSGRPETGLLAALVFLAFFSTYRYGRPFLTNAPEVFCLFLPFAALLLWRPAAAGSRVAFPLLAGVSIGAALLYKSFALVVPAGLALALWHLRLRGGRLAEFLAKDLWRIALALAVALAMFGAWFALDPEPANVWRDFVLRENAGKFDLPGGYLPRLIWGSSSLWSLALGYPLNAGLLFFPVAALFVVAWRRRAELSESEALLWIIVLAFLLVYSVPSQRSSRYLLPAMPALAILLALGWQRIARWTFVLSLVGMVVVVGMLGTLSYRLDQAMPGVRAHPAAHWALLAATGVVAVAGLGVPAFTRPAALAGTFLAYLSFAHSLQPFDGPAGRYDEAARANARGREVLVPYDFVAKEERYLFLLPGARLVGYREERRPAAPEPLPRDSLVVLQVAIGGDPCPECSVVGRRLDIRGRQTRKELREVLEGRVSPALFVEELLVRTPGSGTVSAAPGDTGSGRP